MNCTCTNGCQRCANEPIQREVFTCPGSQRVNRIEHVVRHQHDIINEYNVIHEHDFNTRDVVMEREVVRHNDHRPYTPNYCGDDCGNGERTDGCGCGDGCGRVDPCRQPVRTMGGRFWSGRRW